VVLWAPVLLPWLCGGLNSITEGKEWAEAPAGAFLPNCLGLLPVSDTNPMQFALAARAGG